MKWKVCGMREPENLAALLELEPDYIGMIFYAPSPRYAPTTLESSQALNWGNTQKVGVFVNESLANILELAADYQLDVIQLHGTEPPALARSLKEKGLQVIKAFSVGKEANYDFSQLEPYKEAVDFFLFDTKGKQPGGNGYRFNWEVLEQYDQEVPFWLSGGLDLETLKDWKVPSHWNLHAIDVNSRFELEPGKKDLKKLKQLKAILL